MKFAPIVASFLLLSTMQIFAQTPKPHEVEDFIRKAKFNEIKISPTGEFSGALLVTT